MRTQQAQDAENDHTGYALANAAEQTPDRFTALEACYDTVSKRVLASTEVRDGWRCWELGGGGGSLVAWLSDAVGPEGHVTATDTDTQRMTWLQDRPNMDLIVHDVVHDPPPGDHYDLIHARLVLLHLPAREEILRTLVQALKPGGLLVLEEFDCDWLPILASDDDSARLFEKIHAAFLQALRHAGANPSWGREVFGALVRAGLENVSATTYAEAWPGGSSGIDLHRANTEQLAAQLLATGISERELQRFWSLLRDPSFVVNSYPMFSAVGRRPQASERSAL